MKYLSTLFANNLATMVMILAIILGTIGITKALMADLIISNVTAINITDQTATITWTTNSKSNSKVDYGLAPGNYPNSFTMDESLTEHIVVLSSLKPNTSYYYKVTSQIKDGSSSTSAEYIFKTLSQADLTAPVISNLEAKNITENQATITWSTNEAASSLVKYGEAADALSSTYLNETLSGSHQVTLSSLKAQTKYYFKVSAKDSAGNITNSADKNFTTLSSSSSVQDKDYPVISEIAVTNITETGAVINWKTNEAANSEVKYGPTATYDKTKSMSDLVTTHQVNLNDLIATTAYHFQINSKDAAGNTGTSPDQTFTTLNTGQSSSGDLKIDYTLNGTLQSATKNSVTVKVLQGSNSMQSQIGNTLTIQVTEATQSTQDGQAVEPDQLIINSNVNINGYYQGPTYYANRIEARNVHAVLSGLVQSIDTAASQLTIQVKTASSPLKSYLGQSLTIKVNSDTVIRLNGYYSTLAQIPLGKNAQITGTISDGTTIVADHILIIYR